METDIKEAPAVAPVHDEPADADLTFEVIGDIDPISPMRADSICRVGCR
jgi:hypothetical protein